MATETEVLSAVIGAIYDAAIDASKWPLALKAACDFVGGAEAMLFWQGMTPEAVGVFHPYNNDPHYTQLYLERLAPFNPGFPAILLQDVGSVFAFSDLVSEEEEKDSIFYREWIAPQRFTGSLSVLLQRDATRFAVLSFPWRDGAIDTAARRRFSLLVPHMQRAVAISQLLEREAATRHALIDTLEMLDAAVFILAKTGRIVVTNARGKRLVEDGSLLRQVDDKLHATDLVADRALRHGLLALASRNALLDGRDLTVDLGATSDSRMIAQILPLTGKSRRFHNGPNAIAAVFVHTSAAAPSLPIEGVARKYGLTAGEMRVADAVLRISGHDAIATTLGISRATVKTHLNRIYQKCGVTRQSELIQLVVKLNDTGKAQAERRSRPSLSPPLN